MKEKLKAKCPQCGEMIEKVFFCGDDYYGSYELGEELTLAFTCINCVDDDVIFTKTIKIPKKFINNKGDR